MTRTGLQMQRRAARAEKAASQGARCVHGGLHISEGLTNGQSFNSDASFSADCTPCGSDAGDVSMHCVETVKSSRTMHTVRMLLAADKFAVP